VCSIKLTHSLSTFYFTTKAASKKLLNNANINKASNTVFRLNNELVLSNLLAVNTTNLQLYNLIHSFNFAREQAEKMDCRVDPACLVLKEREDTLVWLEVPVSYFEKLILKLLQKMQLYSRVQQKADSDTGLDLFGTK